MLVCIQLHWRIAVGRRQKQKVKDGENVEENEAAKIKPLFKLLGFHQQFYIRKRGYIVCIQARGGHLTHFMRFHWARCFSGFQLNIVYIKS